MVTWLIKNVISPLSQGLWTPNLVGWWFRMRKIHPSSCMTLQLCGHVTNEKYFVFPIARHCSIVGKPLCYPGSIPRGSYTTRSPPRAVRPTQPFILSRSVNEYRIIPGLTPGYRQWGLLPSTTTGGMADG